MSGRTAPASRNLQGSSHTIQTCITTRQRQRLPTQNTTRFSTNSSDSRPSTRNSTKSARTQHQALPRSTTYFLCAASTRPPKPKRSHTSLLRQPLMGGDSSASPNWTVRHFHSNIAAAVWSARQRAEAASEEKTSQQTLAEFQTSRKPSIGKVMPTYAEKSSCRWRSSTQNTQISPRIHAT